MPRVFAASAMVAMARCASATPRSRSSGLSWRPISASWSASSLPACGEANHVVLQGDVGLDKEHQGRPLMEAGEAAAEVQ